MMDLLLYLTFTGMCVMVITEELVTVEVSYES
jgi:hypothetical protein